MRALALLGSFLLFQGTAAADDYPGPGAGLLVVAAVAAAADVSLGAGDVVFAARSQVPSTAWCVTELSLATPQFLALGFALGATLWNSGPTRGAWIFALLALPSAILLTHAVWALASAPASFQPSDLIAPALALAATADLVIGVIDFLERGSWPETSLAVTELVVSLPQLAWGGWLALQAIQTGVGTDAPLAAALLIVSGAMLVHSIWAFVTRWIVDSPHAMPIPTLVPVAAVRSGVLEPALAIVGVF